MAPQNNDTETNTLSADHLTPEVDIKSVAADTTTLLDPIKNAFNQRVQYAELSAFARGVRPDTAYPPIPVLEYHEKGVHADPTLKNLLETASIRHLSPKVGSVVTGVQLHELTDAQKDELALLASVRGVVYFEDQEITVDEQLALHRYYGPLHIHQSNLQLDGYPEVFLVEATVENAEKLEAFHRASGLPVWHSDVSYERQPPSYTSLRLHAAPEVGADTIWVSSYEAYERLSPQIKTLLDGLTAIHSSKNQADNAAKHGHSVHRPYVEFEHPVVRTHPVTKRKALYVNPGFTTRIPQLTPAESNALLRFLFDHIRQGHEFQVRYHLSKNSVAFWDNRITTHFATFDHLPNNRQGTRVTTQAEIPYFDPQAQPIV